MFQYEAQNQRSAESSHRLFRPGAFCFTFEQISFSGTVEDFQLRISHLNRTINQDCHWHNDCFLIAVIRIALIEASKLLS